MRTRVGPRNNVLRGVDTDAIGKIPLNRPCGYAAFLSNYSDHNGVSTASTLLLTVWVPQTIAVIPQWKQQCSPGRQVLRGCVVRSRARPRQLYAVEQSVSAADPGECSSQTLHRRTIRLRTGTTPADNYTCTVHTFCS